MYLRRLSRSRDTLNEKQLVNLSKIDLLHTRDKNSNSFNGGLSGINIYK